MRGRLFTILALLSLAACAAEPGPGAGTAPPAAPAMTGAMTGGSPPSTADLAERFALPPAETGALAERPIYATRYIARLAVTDRSPGAIDLPGPDGRPLGLRVSRASYCHGAMEGTLLVRDGDGPPRRLNYAGTGPAPVADCRDIFSTMARERPAKLAAVSRSRFVEMAGTATPYGTGATGPCGGVSGPYRLVPHRSIAVDRAAGPVRIGGVLYIPSLRGVGLTLPGGGAFTHDGYVFAADTGGAVRGPHHIDYFKGPAENDHAPPALGGEGQNIPAYVVTDPGIVAALCGPHLIRPPG